MILNLKNHPGNQLLEYLPFIRIKSPPHSVAKAGTLPAPFSPTLKPTHGGPSGAAMSGKLYGVPAVAKEPQGPSGQTYCIM